MLTSETMTSEGDILKIIIADIKARASELGLPVNAFIKKIANPKTVCKKTLERVISEKDSTMPRARTILYIYSSIYQTNSMADLLIKLPTVIKTHIEKSSIFDEKKSHAVILDSNSNEQLQLTKDSNFNQVYLMTGGDHGTTLQKIRESLGKKGIIALNKAIQKGFVKINENERLVRGDVKIEWGPESMLDVSGTIQKDIYNLEKAQIEKANKIMLLVSDVTEPDRIRMYDALDRLHEVICDIMDNSKPTEKEAKRVCLSIIMDTIDTNDDEDEGADLQ